MAMPSRIGAFAVQVESLRAENAQLKHAVRRIPWLERRNAELLIEIDNLHKQVRRAGRVRRQLYGKSGHE